MRLGLLVGLALSAIVGAQAPAFPNHIPLDKDELEVWKKEAILGRLDDTRTAVLKILETNLEVRRLTCELAIGHKPFCACLNDRLPLKMSLPQYVTFASTPVPELPAGQWTPDEIRLGSTARDYCVVTNFALKR